MLPEKVISILKEFSPVHKENQKNIIIRCPYCGDSKHPRHVHMYISKTDPPYPFHCFRAECEASGTLIQFLSDFNLLGKLDPTSLQELYKKRYSNRKFKNNHIIFTQKNLNTVEAINKLEYVKNRLTLNDLPEWITRFIVSDFTTIISNDKVNIPYKDHLQDNYVGFLTYLQRKIISRRITNNNFLPRYIHIPLSDNTRDFFVTFPDKNIELVDTNGSLLISEGVFDALGGYLILKNYIDTKNIVLCAAGGKYYSQAYLFLRKRFGLNWNVYLLTDKDISEWFIRKQFKYIKTKSLYMVKNRYSKDFGDLNLPIDPVFKKLR